ncbi:hypothetical protein [Xanthomonas campestris]|uniref:hypothetical protein n=1 Tax=Xanthomonas campestris TaxID=339 RepID=UPI0012FD9545|nr:hypothetical protein [Xanthomonas campestris]
MLDLIRGLLWLAVLVFSAYAGFVLFPNLFFIVLCGAVVLAPLLVPALRKGGR